MSRTTTLILAVIASSLIGVCLTNYVAPREWANYKVTFNKTYASSNAEANAQYYYAYNKQWITEQNEFYYRGEVSYKLEINQFSDMSYTQFYSLFPEAIPSGASHATSAPLVNPAPVSYDPIKSFGFSINIENQGTKCNSGWAYAAVKAIEILQAYQTGDLNPASLSAQNVIDCAGRTIGCSCQVPKAAFEYLIQNNKGLLLESAYKNNNNLNAPGTCAPNGLSAVNLAKYSTIRNGDDEALKKYVAAGFPVVIDFNPTSFEFMHYAEGIFQPYATQAGSHFMVVIGYDTDPKTGEAYWLVQNSFGRIWGENGLIRIARSPSVKLAVYALFPSELA